MSARCNHRHALTLADETIGRLKAENARLSAYKDRLRGECVGALTEAGIYMLVSPEDPTGPGEVSSAIERLAAERDSFLTSYDNLDHRHTEMTERADKAEAERDAARALVRDLRDPSPCSHFDHHGYCQTHGWMQTDPPCPHARAATYLAERP